MKSQTTMGKGDHLRFSDEKIIEDDCKIYYGTEIYHGTVRSSDHDCR